jgi:hypothetical protein
MSERGLAEIRQEMAVERRRLEDSRALLLAELRSFVPVIVAGVVAAGLVAAGIGARGGIRMIRKLS